MICYSIDIVLYHIIVYIYIYINIATKKLPGTSTQRVESAWVACHRVVSCLFISTWNFALVARGRSISEISSCFFGPRPWHIEIRHRVKTNIHNQFVRIWDSQIEKSKIEIMETDRMLIWHIYHMTLVYQCVSLSLCLIWYSMYRYDRKPTGLRSGGPNNNNDDDDNVISVCRYSYYIHINYIQYKHSS